MYVSFNFVFILKIFKTSLLILISYKSLQKKLIEKLQKAFPNEKELGSIEHYRKLSYIRVDQIQGKYLSFYSFYSYLYLD